MKTINDLIGEAAEAECDECMRPEVEAIMLVLHKVNDESRRKLIESLVRIAFTRGGQFFNGAHFVQVPVQNLDNTLEPEFPDEQLN